jgi:hypothetical protein
MGDMQNAAERAASNSILRLLGTLTGPLALAGIVYIATELPELQRQQAVMNSTLGSFVADRYRADEARRDFQLRDLKIDTLESRVRDLEHQVRSTDIKVDQVAPLVRKRSPQ